MTGNAHDWQSVRCPWPTSDAHDGMRFYLNVQQAMLMDGMRFHMDSGGNDDFRLYMRQSMVMFIQTRPLSQAKDLQETTKAASNMKQASQYEATIRKVFMRS